MEQKSNDPRFPERQGSVKIHGDPEEEEQKKKKPAAGGNESSHLTDISGEEKKEDYINTDERKRDLEGK